MKIGLKRKLAGLLVMLMMVSVILCDRSALSAHAAGEAIAVDFSDGSVSGNEITYNVGETQVTLTVSGGDVSGKTVSVPRDNLGSVTFRLSAFDANTMQVRAYVPDGMNTILTVTNNETSLAARGEGGYPDSVKLVVESKSNSGGGNPDPGPESTTNSWKLKLKIGNQEIDDIRGDNSYQVANIEDLQSITVLQQTKNEEVTVNVTDEIQSALGGAYNGQSMSTTCLDAEGRGVLEVYTISEGAHFKTINLKSHYESFDNTAIENFYVMNITFYDANYQGIKVEQVGAKPDMFESMVLSNQVDIAASTRDNPQTIEQYFGNNTFTVTGVNNVTAPVQVALADNINPDAVTINGSSVTFNSNFYDEVTFKVTQGGTEGYVKVQRLGLTIQTDGIRNAAQNYVNHGGQQGVSWAGTEYANKANIVATFYYDSSKTYADYHVIATLTYAGGRVETKEVAGIGEKYCVDPNLKGGDYILYSGTEADAPVKVSATVVKANAIAESNFGGACFGNGAGVTYNVQ